MYIFNVSGLKQVSFSLCSSDSQNQAFAVTVVSILWPWIDEKQKQTYHQNELLLTFSEERILFQGK